MRYLLIIYLKIWNILKKFLLFIFSENSRIINLFVTVDIFIRKYGFLNQFVKGKFKYDKLVFCHDPSDISVASSILANGTYEPELLKEIFTELKRLNFSNFQILLEPRIFIKDLNNLDDIELLKKSQDDIISIF